MEPTISAKTFVTSLSDIKFAFKPVSAIYPHPSLLFHPLFFSLCLVFIQISVSGPRGLSVVSQLEFCLSVSSVLRFPLYMAAKRRQNPKPFFSYHFYYVTPLIKSLEKLQTQDFLFFPPVAGCYQHVQLFIHFKIEVQLKCKITQVTGVPYSESQSFKGYTPFIVIQL